MTVIKIDRSTIKKNANEGITMSYIMGMVETKFETICSKQEFQVLISLDSVIVIKTGMEFNGCIKASGFIDNPKFDFKQLPGKWSVELSNNIETIHHFPIPKYSFNYEDTPIECNECKKQVRRSEIEEENDYDNTYDVCPFCKSAYSFDYEFQDISEIMNKQITA